MLVAAKQRNECSKSDASEIQKKAKQRKADRRKPSHPCKAKYQNINAMATVNPKIGFAHPSEQQAQRAISPAPAARVGGRMQTLEVTGTAYLSRRIYEIWWRGISLKVCSN